MAREFSEPLADALFGSDEIPTVSSVDSEIADRPVFDRESLPKEVWAPTYSDRIEEKEQRDIAKKAMEKAVKEK